MPWKINNYDYWRPNVNKKFDSIWGNKLGKTQHTVAMDRNLENYDFGLKDANVKILKKILTMSLSHINVTNATILLLRHAIWGIIWKRTVEKSPTNATNVTMRPLKKELPLITDPTFYGHHTLRTQRFTDPGNYGPHFTDSVLYGPPLHGPPLNGPTLH